MRKYDNCVECRANVGIVGILFHQDILSSPALLIPFQENTRSTKIIQVSKSSSINCTGKFPVHFIRDYTLFPHMPHGKHNYSCRFF